MQTVHNHRASVHRAAKLAVDLLRVVRVTAGLVESNGRLPPGLWLTSPAGWLPRTGISSGTLHSAIKHGLHLVSWCHQLLLLHCPHSATREKRPYTAGCISDNLSAASADQNTLMAMLRAFTVTWTTTYHYSWLSWTHSTVAGSICI